MAIDCSDLCKFSQRLAVSGASEVELRAAGSRAYYSAYHSLLWLGSLLPPSQKYDERSHHIGHRELQRRISDWNTAGVHPDLAALKVVKQQVAFALESARKFREACDYQLEEGVSYNEASSQIERARRVLRHAKQFYETVYPGSGETESGAAA